MVDSRRVLQAPFPSGKPLCPGEVKSVGQLPAYVIIEFFLFEAPVSRCVILLHCGGIMDSLIIIVPVALLSYALVFYLGWAINSKLGKNTIANAEERAKNIVDDAEKEARNIKREKLIEVKDEWFRKKQEFDNEVNKRNQKLGNFEKQLKAREENLEKKFDVVNQREKDLKDGERKLQLKTEQITKE